MIDAQRPEWQDLPDVDLEIHRHMRLEDHVQLPAARPVVQERPHRKFRRQRLPDRIPELLRPEKLLDQLFLGVIREHLLPGHNVRNVRVPVRRVVADCQS